MEVSLLFLQFQCLGDDSKTHQLGVTLLNNFAKRRILFKFEAFTNCEERVTEFKREAAKECVVCIVEKYITVKSIMHK